MRPDDVRTARHSGQYVALLVLDIDHFKTINDRYGHPAGDAVLHAVARTISGDVRAYDLVGRYGGDELVILLPDTTATEANHVAERIRARIQALAIQAPTHLGAERLTAFTASIGVAVYPTDGATLDAVMQAADRACYSVKPPAATTSWSAVPFPGPMVRRQPHCPSHVTGRWSGDQ